MVIQAPGWMQFAFSQSNQFFLLTGIIIVLGILLVLLVIEMARGIPFWLGKKAAEKVLTDPDNVALLRHIGELEFDLAHQSAIELLEKIHEVRWDKVSEPKDMIRINQLVTDLEIIKKLKGVK